MNRAQIEACEVRGIAGQAMWSTAESLWMLYDAGRWDEALNAPARAIEWATEHGGLAGRESIGLTLLVPASWLTGAASGETTSWSSGTCRHARQIGDLQILSPALVTAAVVEHARAKRVERHRAPPRVRRGDAERPDRVPGAPAAGGGPHLPGTRRGRARAQTLAGDATGVRHPDEERDVERAGAARRDARRDHEMRTASCSKKRRRHGSSGAIRSNARTRSTGWRGASRRSGGRRTRRARGARCAGDLRRASASRTSWTSR